MTFRLLPHTADVKAELAAPDLAGLYGAAVDLVRALLVGDSPVAARVDVVVTVTGGVEEDDEAERFFRFVRELVYLADADGFLPARLKSMQPPTVSGEAFDDRRHAVEHGIKAVTRHQYRFVVGPEGHHAEMVFDL